jgi:hypothetical protein
LDESADITGKAQLLVITRFVCNGDITGQFLFCRPLSETTKGQVILDVVDSEFSSHDLSWKPRICICTDGAPSVSGGPRKDSSHCPSKIVFKHCFLHREALISKSVVPEALKVLDEKIKSRLLESRLFSAWELLHTTPTAHRSEVAISRVGAFEVL